MITEVIGGVTVHTIKAGTYLSEVVTELPAGIINKTETGIGATTVELKAPRHSIIVEPLKVTASAKAKKHSAFYLGSPTIHHPEGNNSKIKKALQAYLSDSTIVHKKFVVVADSLGKLKHLLGDSFKDYFLMIDEADRMQMDVNFRSLMAEVYRIYKAHDSSKRCMITATPVHYNDPDLKSEVYTKYKFDVPTRRKVSLMYASTPEGCILDLIKHISTKYPEQKIVIAFNQVGLAYNLAQFLVDNGVATHDEVSIMCSEASKANAGEFYCQLETTKLPSRIVFKTAAYYNGFDIDERYHLVSYVQPNSVIHAHSIDTLKQIAGRCRDKAGLLSETIVYATDTGKVSHKVYTLPDLLKEAETIKMAYTCLSSHLKHSELLREQVDTIFNNIDTLPNIYGYPLVVIKNKVPEISYLSIDSILETNRVIRTELVDVNSFETQLKKVADIVRKGSYTSATVLPKSTRASASHLEELDKIKNTLERSISMGKTDPTFGVLVGATLEPELIYLKRSSLSYYAIDLYERFRKHIDNVQLKDKILKACEKGKPKAQLDKLNKQLMVSASSDTDTLKKRLMTTFETGSNYQRTEVVAEMRKLVKEFSKTSSVKETDDNLVTLFKTLIQVKQTSEKGKTGKVYKVIGYNPAEVEVFNPLSEFKTNSQAFKEVMMNVFNPSFLGTTL